MPSPADRRLSRSRITVLAALTVLALAGCTDGQSGAPRTTTASSSAATPPAGGTSSPAPSVAPTTAGPVADQQAKLVDFGTGPSLGDDPTVAVNARYLVRPDASDPNTIDAIRLSDRHVVIRHRPADDKTFQTTFAALAGDRLVLLDEDIASDDSMTSGSGKSGDIGFVYNLTTGAKTAVSSIASAPTPSPYAAEGVVNADGDWYYSAQTKGHFANCVGELNLITLKGHMVECASGKGAIWYVNSTSNGVAWTELSDGSITGCRTGRALVNGSVVTVGPAGNCTTFDTATLDGWSLWSDQSRTELVPYLPLHASNGTAPAVALGNVRAMDLEVCGGYAYWITGAMVGGSHDNLMRWQPGGTTQTVLEVNAVPGSLIEDDSILPYGCNDNILTISVNRYHEATHGYTVQVFAIMPPNA